MVSHLRLDNRYLKVGYPPSLPPSVHDTQPMVFCSRLRHGHHSHPYRNLQHLHLNLPLLAGQICLDE